MKTTLQVRMAKQNFQFTLITFFVWIVNVLIYYQQFTTF